MTLNDVDTMVVSILNNSRAATTAERYLAINHAYREIVRTILDVRSDHFLFETGDFTIPGGAMRVPLRGVEFTSRPVQRIRKIVSLGPDAATLGAGTVGYGSGGYGGNLYGGGTLPGNTASAAIRKWTPRAISSREFQQAELLGSQDSPEVLYDLIYPAGQPTLALAPALISDDTPFISTIYEPVRLTVAASVIEPIIEKHIELVVAYAMDWLLRAVNDPDADRWGADAVQLRSHLIQHISPKIEQETQAVGSALWDLGVD